ncbi:hypothetical protein ACFL3F_03145 [Planctomycetota bacterium]
MQELQYRHFEEGEEIPTTVDIWREHFGIIEEDLLDDDLSNSGMMVETASEQTPDEIAQEFLDISGALGHLQTLFPEDHPDIVNLRNALHGILDDPEAVSKLESLAGEVGPSKLGTGNPYEMDSFEEAGHLYDQQMKMVETQWGNPHPSMQPLDYGYGFTGEVIPGDDDSLENNVLSTERMAYEEDLGPAGPLDAPGPLSLEQVIDDYYEQATDGHSSGSVGIPLTDSNPLAPESLPEMDEALQAGMLPSYAEHDLEEDPLQMLDPMAVAQQIFDEQMQFMENPFMPDMLAPPGVMPGL